MTEAQAKANKKYNEKLRTYCLKLNHDKDADIIAVLESQKNKTEYIKQLVRNMIRNDT